MIDLHAHVLPGVDDGAGSLEEAVRMCRAAAADGCTALVATPHQRHDAWPNDDLGLLERLLDDLKAQVADVIDLFLGAEIRLDSELVTDLRRRRDSGLLPLAGTRYLLVEYDRSGLGPEPVGLTEDLLAEGWLPIFAHPEFLRTFADFQVVEQLVEVGAAFQITAMSLTGDFGTAPQSYVERMIDRSWAHFVASDAHSLRWRSPGLSRAYQHLRETWNEETALRLTRDNPRAVLEDRPVTRLRASHAARSW